MAYFVALLMCPFLFQQILSYFLVGLQSRSPHNSFNMGLFNLSKNKTNDDVTPVEAQTSTAVDSEKGVDSRTPSEKDHDHEGFSSNAQAGVKAVEAAATVWTKYHLIGAYVM